MPLFLKIIKSSFIFVLSLFAWMGEAKALSSDWKGIDKAQVRLISATTGLGESGDILLGLQFHLQKGWKVYWRSPGDAGYPPELEWDGSQNFLEAEMRWPRPERFEVLGLETIGYKKQVVYPIRLKVKDPTKPLNIKSHLRFLTCSEVCVPVETNLQLDIPPGPALGSDHAQRINQFNSLVPLDARTQGLSLETARLHPNPDQKTGTLRLHFKSNWALQSPDIFSEGPVELAFFKPKMSLSTDRKEALVDVPLEGLQFLEDGFVSKPFTFTLMDGLRALEIKTNMTEGTGPLAIIEGFQALQEDIPFLDPGLSLATILGFALLGGLILNLMPCVLPVLSLKILGLVSHGGGNQKTVRLSFLASSAGIISSFLVLAGILILMKNTGAAIGWGIQFQQPIFLVTLSLIVVLFACNMWGFFEIHLPSWLSNMGEHSTHMRGLGSHFMTGAFATVLATPCSAPFLGTAIGFALARGPVEILLVFACLGLGLSLPYLLIAGFPNLATRLPKPGAWMVTLRKILGLVLLGTALWLLTILIVQIGMTPTLILGALISLFILVLAFKTPLKKTAKPLALTLFLAAFSLPFASPSSPTTDMDEQASEKIWVKFDQDKITQLVRQGQVIFVDVTAKWCITCQVNKNLVLYQDETFHALSQENITAMKADWTNPDEVITNYLAKFERYAIPFNIVYGPGAPKGIVLPELLTQDVVLSAISKAKG